MPTRRTGEVHGHHLADDSGDWEPPPKLFSSVTGSTMNPLGATSPMRDLICDEIPAHGTKRTDHGCTPAALAGSLPLRSNT